MPIFTRRGIHLEKNRTIIKPPAGISFGFSELWQHRELLYFFAWRDIKVKYKQTVLGILWAVLQPLALMLLFSFIFSKTSIAATPAGIRYEIFVLSGLVLWNLFYTSVSHAADSMIVNAGIIKKIYFPRLIIPLSTIVAALLDFAVSLVLFAAFCLFYEQPVNVLALLYFP
ncbi:MAG TPA: ABC transporter permease, partial [Chitinophagaceae bacterium]|nr:ABC transporter permease [Chitinophagaceae bacterium]